MATVSPAAGAQVDDDVIALASNVAISGVTAGVVRLARGESFWDGLLGGAAGGAVTYVGKEVATWDGSRLGLLGRELAAVGTSVTRAAAFGSGLLDTLILPVGPVRLRLTPSELRRTTIRVDAEELIWIAYAATSDRYRFHAARSLSTGAFVFSRRTASLVDDGARITRIKGEAASGIMWLHEQFLEETLPHEAVHIIQIDQVKALAGLPLEGWIRRSIRGPRGAEPRPWRWLDVGVGQYPFRLLVWDIMETEADALAR
jgi:hypothetical protein